MIIELLIIIDLIEVLDYDFDMLMDKCNKIKNLFYKTGLNIYYDKLYEEEFEIGVDIYGFDYVYDPNRIYEDCGENINCETVTIKSFLNSIKHKVDDILNSE